MTFSVVQQSGIGIEMRGDVSYWMLFESDPICNDTIKIKLKHIAISGRAELYHFIISHAEKSHGYDNYIRFLLHCWGKHIMFVAIT